MKLLYLCQEAVHKDWLGLAEAVGAEDGLEIVGGVPARVKDDHAVGSDQVHSQRTSTGGDQEQPHPGVRQAMK